MASKSLSLPLPPLLLLLLSLFLLVSHSSLAEERGVNKSAQGGVFWATGQDETDLLARAESDDAYAVDGDAGEFAGGFSSLDGMLQWAIGHSDPVKFKEKANDVQRSSVDELTKRRMELKELMDQLKMPSDAELMQIAIADLNNLSLSSEDRRRALNELLFLVEEIDNANDLDKLGGLAAVVRELSNSEPEIRTTSAWILGKASQNNALVQDKILAVGALTKLMKMVKSSFIEEAIKAFYAISALIRNNAVGQQSFFQVNGDLMLQDILSNSSIDIRLQKKAIFLVADLADYQLDDVDTMRLPFFSNHIMLKSVVDLTSSPDLDLQEKALLAIRSLLQLTSTDLLVLKDICHLDVALERMRDHLGNLMMEDDLKEYARDVEGLRREVFLIFHRKLEKQETWVPT